MLTKLVILGLLLVPVVYLITSSQAQDSVTVTEVAMTNASCNHTVEFWCNNTCLLKKEACSDWARRSCPDQNVWQCGVCPGETHRCDFWKFACLPAENVCDGIADCRKGDDEFDCEIRRCPGNCSCYMNESTLMDISNAFEANEKMMTTTCTEGWNETTFERIAKTTDYLWLKKGDIGTLNRGYFKAFYHPLTIAVPDNGITQLVRRSFEGSYYMTWLDISDNKIREVVNGVFETMARLQHLMMYNVPIKHLRTGAFFGLSGLKTFVLVRPRQYRRGAIRVEKDAFTGMDSLETIYVDDQILCCNFKHINACIPVTGPLPPLLMCGSLFETTWIRILGWTFGIMAIVGNLLVILAKSLGEPENETWKVHKFLEANIAASKIFMGIFLCVLVRGDFMYWNDYLYHQFRWQSGPSCRFAGVSALVSCESFVLLYGLVSYVHFKRLTEPIPFYKVGIATAAIWGVAVVLALFGLIGHRDSGFYEMTNHCIGLPLVRRPSDVVTEINTDIISNEFYNRSIAIKMAHGTQSTWGYSVFLWFIINLPLIVAGTVLHLKSCMITWKLENLKPDEEVMFDDTEEKELEELDNPEVEIRVTGTGRRLGFVLWVDCFTWGGMIVMFFAAQVGLIEVTVRMYTIVVVVVLAFGSFLCPIVFMFAFLCTGEYEEDPPNWYEERLAEMLREEEEERLRLEEEERIQQEAEEKLRLEEEEKKAMEELAEAGEEGEMNDGFEGVEVEGESNKGDGSSAGDSGVAEAGTGSGSGSGSHSGRDSAEVQSKNSGDGGSA